VARLRCAWTPWPHHDRHARPLALHQDPRFLGQFDDRRPRTTFVPYSKYPPCYKDLTFWLPAAAGGDAAFHDNNFFEVVRGVAGDLVENVAMVRSSLPFPRARGWVGPHARMWAHHRRRLTASSTPRRAARAAATAFCTGAWTGRSQTNR
jgi:hypothetical protein